MSESNIDRLKAAGVLKHEHAADFGDAEVAHVESLSSEDVDHLIRIQGAARSSDSDAEPIACFY